MTNHIWDGQWIIGNRNRFEQLPLYLQTIVSRNMNDTAVLQRADIMALNTLLEKNLPALTGMEVTRPNIAPFIAKLNQTNFYSYWRTSFGGEAWAILEKYAGPLLSIN